jgi:hypothetical protein
MSPLARKLAVLSLGAATTAGCTGSIDAMTDEAAGPTDRPVDSPRPGPSTGAGGAGPSTGGAAGSGPSMGGLIDAPKPPAAGGGGARTCTAATTVPATPRLVRLTRQQYENAVRDLTGLDVRPAADLPEDPVFAGFDRGLELEVGEVVSKVYRDQAEAVARQAVSSSANLGKLVGCDPKTGDACIDKFVGDFGKRAFRRPLTPEEKTKFIGLFKKGDALVEGSGDAFGKGVRVTLEAMLQSPKFLYRIETSTKKDGAVIPLNSYEIASRLSFTLVNTMPDAALLEAADRNELVNPDNAVMHARRLLGTAAGRATVRDFHRQWMGTDTWEDRLEKDTKLFPTVKPSLAPVLKKEFETFVETLTFDRKKGLTSMLTAPFTFANKVTAPLYGAKGTFTDDLKEIELDPTQRAGMLTQVGFLASHALSNQSSPIHRGVFVLRRVLCATIPDPAEQVPALPPPSEGKTTREVVHLHTEPDGCRACHHSLINPVGYGLETFDAVGQWRTMDNGKPVDATGRLTGIEKPVDFNGPIDMMKKIVDAPEARACYAKQWWRYSFGRDETAADACALETLANALGNDGYTSVDLMVDMVRTKAFMFRNAEAQ